MNSVRSVARETNDISRYQVYQIMRDFIGYKPYMMHSVQQLYDKDVDLGVKMSEHLIPVLEDEHDGNISFSDESTFYICGVVNTHSC